MHRGWRIALMAAALVAAALAAAGAVFLAGIEVHAEFLRAPIERALTAAFRVPTRIEGPLKLHTGLTATVSADALVLDDPSGPGEATLARGIRPAARIDLAALLRRVVVIEEVTGEKLELTLVRRADGHANWAPIFAPSAGGSAAPVSFGGIDRLRIGTVGGSYQREGDAPVPFAITALDGGLPLREPVTARGSAQVAGQSIAFDLRSAPFADLVGSAAALPVQGTAQWSATRVEIKGELARDGARFDADLQASADDAGLPLAALGIEATQTGRLDLRLRLGVTATEAAAQGVALTVGESVIAGGASIAWAGPRWRVAADLAGERIDLAPFALAKSLPQEKTAPEALVELLERMATGIDAGVRLTVNELAGLPATVRDLRFDGRSSELRVAGSGSGIVSGTRVEIRLDYDARAPRHIFSAKVEGGAASTVALPGEARPRDVSGRVAGIRGRLRAQGENARALLASIDADLEARDLRWAVDRRHAAPLTGRFDRIRLVVQGTRAISAEVTGKLGDAVCSLKVSGGALAPLLEGEPWPLQVAGSCPGARFSAKGRLAAAPRHVVGELAFDAIADRIAPMATALGVAPGLPQPIAARGTLVLDETLTRARLATLRLGRTAGSGEVALPLAADGTARVQLALTMLDLNEFSALAAPAPATTRKDLRLPDLDVDIAASRVTVAGTHARRLQFAGAIRAQKLPPAGFRFDWEGVPVSGRVSADFGGAVPRLEVDARAGDVDLRRALARFGYARVGLQAGVLSLTVRADGASLGEMRAAASLAVAIDRGRLDLPQAPAGGASGKGEFSAALNAEPGQPTRLAARGTFDGEPMELSVEAPGLADMANEGAASPIAVRLAIGDARLEASGRVARSGAAQARLQVSGKRLDRLGELIGVPLPEKGPYSASADLVVSADVIRADDLAVSVARSRVAGEVRIERSRGGRSRYLARLRVPVMHLEDIGADQWLRGDRPAGSTGAADESAGRHEQAESARPLDFLRDADIDAAVDIEALHAAGKQFASGRLRATTEAGVLHVRLDEVRAVGGGLDADIRVDAGVVPPKFALQASARGLEYGLLVQSVDPESTMGGTLDLVADVTAQALAANLLPMVAGRVDAAVYPRGLHSRAPALWGAGMLNAMLRQLDPDSRSAVDCAVGSFDIKDGVASSTAFFVDATRVRIIGEVEVNLLNRALSGRIDPLSKDPAILTFAPTMRLGGTVDSPRLTSAPANVVTVPLRFATSVAGFARDWLGAKSEAREGRLGCREAFEQIRQARSAAQ